MSYDKTYNQSENIFGSEPESILKDFCHRINKSKPVLDIGAGQGRNALFLARQEFAVDAIDPSQVAVETISKLAASENLPIRTSWCDFLNFIPETDTYSAILVFGLIQILSWDQIAELKNKIGQWTDNGSFVFITGFTIEDASFAKYSKMQKLPGINSFTDGKDIIRTFLEPGELPNIFNDYSILHHWEGLGPIHRHGDSKPEQHAMVEAVLLR